MNVRQRRVGRALRAQKKNRFRRDDKSNFHEEKKNIEVFLLLKSTHL